MVATQTALLALALLTMPAFGDETVNFRQGVSSYSGTHDIHLAITDNFTGNGHPHSQFLPDPENPQWVWDFEATWGEGTRLHSSGINRSGRGDHVGLLRFDSIFGDQPGQIPPGATITSATLRLFPDNHPNISRRPGDSANVHEVLVDWDETVRWQTFGPQPGPDYGSDFSSPIVTSTGSTGSDLVLDVTASLSNWSQNPATNHGWLFMPSGAQNVIDVAASAISNITNVTVDLEIDTAQRGELVVTLRHGDYTALLVDRIDASCSTQYGSSGDDLDVTLDDNAATDIHDAPNAPAPLTGTWRPDASCFSFPLCSGGGTAGLCGAPADGEWVLNVYDEWTSANVATLVSWGITLSDGVLPDETYSASPALAIPRRHLGSGHSTAIWSSENPTETLRPELSVTFVESAAFSPTTLQAAPQAGSQSVTVRIPDGANALAPVTVSVVSDAPTVVATPGSPLLFAQGGPTTLPLLLSIGQVGSALLSTTNDGGFANTSLPVDVAITQIAASPASLYRAAGAPDEALRIAIPLGANANSDVHLTLSSDDSAIADPLGAIAGSLPVVFAAGAANWQDITMQFGVATGSATLTVSDDGALLPSAMVPVALSAESPESYDVTIEPYVQLGDAPLGAATDQFVVAWQTITTTQNGSIADRFTVEYRRLGEPTWIAVAQAAPISTGSESRHTRYATLSGLDFEEEYEYRITHLRNEAVEAVYQDTVQTRPTGPFRFTAFGNGGQGIASQALMAQVLANQDPDLHLMLGDNVYYHGEYEHLKPRISDVYGSLMRDRAFHYTLGNHDKATDTGQPSLDFFFEPENGPGALVNELNYSFDYGDVHFVNVNSGSGLGNSNIETEIAPWLAADLAASTKIWKVVFTHEPPVTRDPYGVDRGEQALVRDHLLKAAVENGAQLFLSGATHSMQRYLPITEVTDVDPFVKWSSCEGGEGTALVYAGTASWFRGPPGPIPAQLDPPMELYAPQLGVAVIDVDADSMSVSMIDQTGVEIDAITILPCTNPADCQCPSEIQLYGIARGDQSISITIAGVVVSVPTTLYLSAPNLVAALANAVNTHPTLINLGFTATADGNTLSSNANIKNLTITDPGIAATQGALTLPALSPPGLAMLILILGAGGCAAMRSREQSRCAAARDSRVHSKRMQ